MKVFAIIPARGGSKGVPSKNLKLLGGKPLIVHTIEAVMAVKYIGRLIVSTDDEKIARISRSCGADVVRRPARISGAKASSESALLHVLHELKKREDEVPDILVFLQCTSPLTRAQDIDGAVQALIKQKADTVFTVCHFYHFIWKQSDREVLAVNHSKKRRLMRQSQKRQYLENGSIYVMRVAGFLKAKHRFFGKTVMHVMPKEHSLEIDEPSDLRVALALLMEQTLKKRLAQLPAKLGAVVFDFDGVFTNNAVIIRSAGQEEVVCSRIDGMGISLLRKMKIPILILSSEENRVVKEWAKKLRVEILSNIKNKEMTLRKWAGRKRIPLSSVIFTGNDANDKECLESVGCGIVVRDAHESVMNSAKIILSRSGGRGAVREVVDLILKKWG